MRRTVVLAIVCLLVLPSVLEAATGPHAADYFVIRGSAVIRTTSDRSIEILVHGFGLAGDDPSGKIDHVFRLSSDRPLPAVDIVTLSAGIEFHGEQLIILAADREEFYVFDVSSPGALRRKAIDAGEDPGRGRIYVPGGVPAGYSFKSFRGFGLNHEIGDKLGNLNFSPRILECFGCVENPDEGGGGSGGSCNSGGPGSTSCSYTSGGNSCSVSCASGYYACCNNSGSCRCVRN